MKDLFVCYAGQVRSPMAVGIARILAMEKGINNYEAESCRIFAFCKRFNKEEYKKDVYWKDNKVYYMKT